MVKISIIIINFNGGELLKNAVNSIKKLKCSYEIIIFDNASTDNSLKYVENINNVKIIKSQLNIGFSKGNNRAIEHATGLWLLLLNNDAELIDDISDLVENSSFSKSVFTLSMIGDNNKIRPNVGRYPNWLCILLPSRIFKLRKNKIEWIEGSFILIQREFWNQIGGFDDSKVGLVYEGFLNFNKKVRKGFILKIYNLFIYFIVFLKYLTFLNTDKRKSFKIFLFKNQFKK